MNALIRKEIRLISPAWGVAMVVLGGAILVAPMPALEGLLPVLFAASAIFLALLPFGQECSLGTFSSLLVQPAPRQRLWRSKTVVLAVALISILSLVLCGYILRLSQTPSGASPGEVRHFTLLCGLIASSAYAGGLWTTLLFRQIAAAFWFTLLVPPLILLLVYSVSERLPDAAITSLITLLLVAYAAAAVLWARRQFLMAQDVQWTGGNIALPGFAWRRPSPPGDSRPRPRRALFWKELQAHQSSLVIAGGLLVMHLAVVCVRAAKPNAQAGAASTVLFEFFWIFWLALPLLIGSSSVAEERRLGTHEGQLCLPAGRYSQMAIKLAVALLLGVFLGGCVPALIESTRHWLGFAEIGEGIFEPSSWTNCGVICAVAAWITLIAFHTSTLARNTLQAAGLSVVSGLVLTGIFSWAATGENTLSQGWRALPLAAWIGAPILLLTLTILASRNFRQSRPGGTTWLFNVVAVALALFLSGVLAAAVHARVWESAARFESPPGPAQLRGTIRPQILVLKDLFVLLPDGRLWAPVDYEVRLAYRYDEPVGPGERVTRTYSVRVPAVGAFVGGSNWVAIAGTHRETVGLRSDGSLWRLFQSEVTEQIGRESDWTDISAGAGFFVGLKENGSLWGWGFNHSGQLGAGEKEIVDPVQVGRDENWKAVFPVANGCVGVKQDGSIWRWGHLFFGPGGSRSGKSANSPEPVEWPLDGSDWLDLTSSGALDLILRRDGTMWASGYLPREVLGTKLPQPGLRWEPVQIGSSSDWEQVDASFGSVAAVKAGKVIFQQNLHASSVPWIPGVWRPSSRSDWIAVSGYGSGGCLALAADGTLSLWGHPTVPPAGFARLLAPSRKPLWTVNILTNLASTNQAKEIAGVRP